MASQFSQDNIAGLSTSDYPRLAWTDAMRAGEEAPKSPAEKDLRAKAYADWLTLTLERAGWKVEGALAESAAKAAFTISCAELDQSALDAYTSTIRLIKHNEDLALDSLALSFASAIPFKIAPHEWRQFDALAAKHIEDARREDIFVGRGAALALAQTCLGKETVSEVGQKMPSPEAVLRLFMPGLPDAVSTAFALMEAVSGEVPTSVRAGFVRDFEIADLKQDEKALRKKLGEIIFRETLLAIAHEPRGIEYRPDVEKDLRRAVEGGGFGAAYSYILKGAFENLFAGPRAPDLTMPLEALAVYPYMARFAEGCGLQDTYRMGGWLVAVSDRLAQIGVSPSRLERALEMFESDTIDSEDTLKLVMEDFLVREALSELVRKGEKAEYARQIVAGIYRPHDLGSLVLFNPRRNDPQETLDAMNLQVHQVILRGDEHSYSFGSFRTDAQRAPGAECSGLELFAKDFGGEITEIVSASRNTFPGPGIIFKGIDPFLAFAADPESPSDPLRLYRSEEGDIVEGLYDLKESTFLLSRGVISVIPPRGSCVVDGRDYSYVFYNEHFQNLDGRRAYLIPTEVLSAELKRASVITGSTDDRKRIDAESFDLSYAALESASKKLGFSILDLCSPSNLAGLHYAFPPSAPYFLPADADRQFADTLTRSFIQDFEIAIGVGGMRIISMSGSNADRGGHSSPEFFAHAREKVGFGGRMVNPLAAHTELHFEVYNAATRGQDIFDAMRLCLAQWHKGQTEVREGGSDAPGEERSSRLTVGEAADVSANRLSLRMLNELYRWHSKEQDPENSKVLVLTSALDGASMPSIPVEIDSFDMVAKVGDKLVQFPKDPHDIDAMLLWGAHVEPHLNGSGSQLVDVRIMDRKMIGGAPAEGLIDLNEAARVISGLWGIGPAVNTLMVVG